MKWIAIANVTLTILFAIKWGIERARFKGLMFFIVAKEYTPPNEKEKKEIAEMVETAKHLATHDPQAFMIAKSNMEILKIRADMDKQEKEPA